MRKSHGNKGLKYFSKYVKLTKKEIPWWCPT